MEDWVITLIVGLGSAVISGIFSFIGGYFGVKSHNFTIQQNASGNNNHQSQRIGDVNNEE